MGVIRTIQLTDEQAEAERHLVEAGLCTDAGEIFAAGLRALADDAALETLIREQVDPLAEAMMSDPADGIPAAQVFAELRAHAAKRFGAA